MGGGGGADFKRTLYVYLEKFSFKLKPGEIKIFIDMSAKNFYRRLKLKVHKIIFDTP